MLVIPMLFVSAPLANAAPRLVGVVTDYTPRPAKTGKPLIWIVRGNDRIPVKDHELLFEGDRLAFDERAGPDACVKALVNANDEVKLDRQHDTVPDPSWAFLQTIMPKLVAAYRWVNATKGEDKGLRRNALSRELDDDGDQLSVFPGAAKTLTIAAGSRDPLWIAWTGGLAPFAVSLERDGKVVDEVTVCETKAADCVRQAQVTVADTDGKPLTLKVTSASGASWTRQLEAAPITWSEDLAKADQLGSLGIFLRATDLLDRDQSRFVLESARELATISAAYPPARTMLETLQDGAHP